MNTAHRIADGFRSVISYWTPTPSISQFIDKGTLTPKEFVEAGEQLTFKFPTWKWESTDPRRQVAWLPPKKQYLATYGVTSRCRVQDLERSFLETQGEVGSHDTWLLPPSPNQKSCAKTIIDEPIASDTTHKDRKEKYFTLPLNDTKKRSISPVQCFSDLDEILEVKEDPLSIQYTSCHSPSAARNKSSIRSYDLSLTYDKYYQTPRLWLRGFNEQGIPLDSSEIFEDILTDYASKTVTIDPHPCTGELAVSIHPCKHASVMKKVVDSWMSHGIKPRHDLALVVLLKFISSVIPTVQYDTTVDIYGFTSGQSKSIK